MEFRRTTLKAFLSLAIVCSMQAIASSCGGNGSTAEKQSTTGQRHERKEGKAGGPQLGTPGGGPVIDKSSDATLQTMIKAVVPEFKQLEFKDAETGKTMKYNLFTPKDVDKSKKYPLVLFMADASTPRDTLISRLLGSLQSPVTNFARVINQVAEKNGSNDAA